MSCDIFVICGEKSSDLLGAEILKEMPENIKIKGVIGNEMEKSAIGILLYSSQPKINYNNFLYTKNWNIHCERNGYRQIDAILNWWNTIDEGTIRHSIYDAQDLGAQGDAGFVNILPVFNSREENVEVVNK